jgi:hypothetical protein
MPHSILNLSILAGIKRPSCQMVLACQLFDEFENAEAAMKLL